jgi:hypothetical protein
VEPDVEYHEGNLQQHGSAGQSGDCVVRCRTVHHDDPFDASRSHPACDQKTLVYLYLQASPALMRVWHQSLVLATLDERPAPVFPHPDP